MQSPWTQTGQHDALCKEPYPGSYGCRVSSGGHSDLEQSAMVRLNKHTLNIFSIWSNKCILKKLPLFLSLFYKAALLTGVSRITLLKLFYLKVYIHVPINKSVLIFSFSVVPQTNVIVSSETPKGSGQEDTPLENLLSK